MNFGREFRWFGARFAVEHKESIDNMFYLHQIALNTFVLQMTWWFFVAVNVGRYTSTSWVSAFSSVHALWFFVLFQLLGNMVQSDISLSSEEAPRLYIGVAANHSSMEFLESRGKIGVFTASTYLRPPLSLPPFCHGEEDPCTSILWRIPRAPSGTSARLGDSQRTKWVSRSSSPGMSSNKIVPMTDPYVNGILMLTWIHVWYIYIYMYAN